eukprot:SAG11_NODE_3019_length_2759_cov_1.335338_4_plen_198_part_01
MSVRHVTMSMSRGASCQVQRDIIRPLCSGAGSCRFVELPGIASHAGPADVFISHTWGALWGTLVVAAVDGAAPGRLVWVDNLAVRQFAGNFADLDFSGVIARCKAVVVVAQALPGVAGLELEPSDQSCMRAASIPTQERPLVAACRAWCLAEINAAMTHGKPLVVKAGSATLRTTADCGGLLRFVADAAMLRNMQHLI